MDNDSHTFMGGRTARHIVRTRSNTSQVDLRFLTVGSPRERLLSRGGGTLQSRTTTNPAKIAGWKETIMETLTPNPRTVRRTIRALATMRNIRDGDAAIRAEHERRRNVRKNGYHGALTRNELARRVPH